MIRFKPSRPTVAAVLAAVLIIVAGSAAVASNMAFKLNKGLYPTVAGKPGAGDNWTSIPFNRPYSTYADLCSQLGLPNVSTTILQINPETGASQSCTCGTSACNTNKLDLSNLPASSLVGGVPSAYLGVRIRNSGFVAGTSSAIVVGSHNPSLQVLLRHIPSVTCDGSVPPGTSSNIGATWLSVPYHTTAVTAQDLCVQLGVPTTIGSATIQRVDPVNGTQPAVSCNTSGASALNLVLGEAVKVRRSSAGSCTAIASIPAHY